MYSSYIVADLVCHCPDLLLVVVVSHGLREDLDEAQHRHLHYRQPASNLPIVLFFYFTVWIFYFKYGLKMSKR